MSPKGDVPGASQFRKLRGKAGRAQAQDAQDAAGAAFYRMDTAQRELRRLVTSLSAHGPDAGAARRVAQDFEALNEDAEARAARYLATLDTHPLGPEDGNAAFAAAVHAYQQAAADIAGMAEALEAFTERHHDDFASTTAVLERLAQHTVAAAAAMEAARAAFAALREQGIAPGEAAGALAEAEAAHTELTTQAGTVAVGQAAALADRVRALAEAAQARAEELPQLREAAQRRLGSLRTKRDAVAHRTGAIGDRLRALRRDFTAASWSDLEDAQSRADKLISDADRELAAAARAAEGGDWAAAAAAQARATARLDAAATLSTTVAERHAAMSEVKADPSARLAAVRFTVRDAQRLVMDGRSTPPYPWADQLDALAERVAGADTLLSGVHPNYWAYLTELAAITDATADLVRRYRAAARN
ncbi:MAG: hypothetical protein ACT4P1_06225 [Sporichthyaceae bacterium]